MHPINIAFIAKTQPDDGALWLPLWLHLRDTADVMAHLLDIWLPPAYAAAIGLDRKAVRKIAIFCALVHDIGKGTPVFQRKLIGAFPEIEAMLAEAGLIIPTRFLDPHKEPHAMAGAEILRAYGCPDGVAAIIGAHHGKPEPEDGCTGCHTKISPVYYFGKENQDAWRDAQRQLVEHALAEAGYAVMSDLPTLSEPAQLLITGLLIMADWIASNTSLFPLLNASDVRPRIDEHRAERALERLSLPPPWEPTDEWKYRDLVKARFRFSPNAMQCSANEVAARMRVPGLLIVEAAMGSGKTEAGLTCAEIMAQKVGAGGAAFFLPTQATSNAMFRRMLAWAERQANTERLSMQLSHAMAEMNDDFAKLSQGKVNIDSGDGESAMIAHAFFRGKKTNLLSDFVVGTVDQLLMAGLRQKHVMLRHLGLAGKVVVIDECHAYDAYMNRYLDTALRWLGEYRTPVILLSATLPSARRAALVKAYTGAKQPDEAVASCRAYPLLTWTDGGEAHMLPVNDDAPGRSVRLTRLADEACVDEIQARLRGGGCAGIIVNTVLRAQKLRSLVQARMPEATVLLDHAQFLAPDRIENEEILFERVGRSSSPERRNGVVVIGTQVLEQSLDLDFDLLATDLCPMDLLLQRMGRLHRHPRNRPEALREAICVVLCAGEGETPEAGAKAIYGEYLLWRTLALLPERISLPGDIAPLTQTTYDGAPLPGEDPKAKEKYDFEIHKKETKARAYCIPQPTKSKHENCIVGWMDGDAALGDAQAQAAVRDGDASLDVLVLRTIDEHGLEIMAGEARGRCVDTDHVPEEADAREIAKQRLRLPHCLCQKHTIEATIAALQAETDRCAAQWTHSPWLHGALLLPLDRAGNAELNGYTLHYERTTGLGYTRNEEAEHEREDI